MSPLLLLLLLLLPAAANSEFPAALPENSTGLNFSVVFPENIAYFHPVLPKNMLQITALYDNTEFTIKTQSFDTMNKKLDKGQSNNYTLDARIEIKKRNTFNKIVQITSNKLITVHAINLKHNSIQTALVLPTDKLVTEYLVPPVPEILGTTSPANIVKQQVTERSPFKLVIVNGENPNTVTVTGITDPVQLEAHQIAQIWVERGVANRSVKASQPVAVLFGHPCAIQHNCTCGQLYAMLPPATKQMQKFYIPPSLADQTEAFILVSGSTEVTAFNPDSPVVETASTAILYRPGLFLTLIPETDFAACYVVHTIHDTQTSALILVHKDLTDGVHVGSLPLENADWKNLKGTEYVSAVVPLALGKSVIWHASSKMAVYFVGTKASAWFGNPAHILSKTPDFRGCVLKPEVLKIGKVAGGWKESLQYCRNQNLELISFPQAQLQRQIHQGILQLKNDSLQEVWIGMRRSSHSGEWYWLSGVPVNDTNWEDGEPGTVHDGQCAIMSLEKNKDSSWSDKDCCEAAQPVCYKEPVLFPI